MTEQAKIRAPAGRSALFDFGLMLVVSGLSLFLLLYVGFGEARRTYTQFHLEKIEAQGRIVQTAMDTYLRAGLPLRHFVGFSTIAEPIVSTDASISAMAAIDESGEIVFQVGAPIVAPRTLLRDLRQGGQPIMIAEDQDGTATLTLLPLRNKFEMVGAVVVAMPHEIVSERIENAFAPSFAVASILAIAFAAFASMIAPRWSQGRTPWIPIGYVVTFAGMAVVVIATMINLYSEGAQARTKELAHSFAHRLSNIFVYNLSIRDLDGLDRIFGEYRRLNPDIAAAGLIVNGRVMFHTDGDAVGRPWSDVRSAYQYSVKLDEQNRAQDVRVTVALPENVVYQRVVRSIKNFAALFVASGFLAGLFLQLAGSVRHAQTWIKDEGYGQSVDAQAAQALDLNLVRPVFFVAVFAEHLTYSFLPQFMHDLVQQAGLPSGWASMPFMVYYVFFALTLIPAGHFSQQYGPRALMYGGLLLAAGGLVSLALPLDLYAVTAARAAAGIGQGMLFIGVQSYILAVASPEKRTQGAAIIVFGFQGGMISGTAIGSLLVGYMGSNGVFALASAIALGMAIYAVILVPRIVPQTVLRAGFTLALRRLYTDLKQVGHNLDFLRTMFLIGVPAKAVLTGVIVFALPLLLSQQNFAQEDIGQIIMLYAAGVLVASTYMARRVDRTGNTSTVLFWGATISGAGLLLVGLMAWEPFRGGPLSTELLIAGVIVVGIAHGCINAPVVTHVADLELSSRIGVSSVTATYRFLERIGHAIGPIIVSQLFFFGGDSAIVVAWVGAAVLVFGLLFIAGASKRSDPMRKVAA